MNKDRGRMPDEHDRIIQENYVYLLNNLDAKHLCPHLHQCGILSLDEMNEVMTVEEAKGRSQGVVKVLDFVRRAGSSAFRNFKQCLIESGYSSVADNLEDPTLNAKNSSHNVHEKIKWMERSINQHKEELQEVKDTLHAEISRRKSDEERDKPGRLLVPFTKLKLNKEKTQKQSNATKGNLKTKVKEFEKAAVGRRRSDERQTTEVIRSLKAENYSLKLWKSTRESGNRLNESRDNNVNMDTRVITLKARHILYSEPVTSLSVVRDITVLELESKLNTELHRRDVVIDEIERSGVGTMSLYRENKTYSLAEHCLVDDDIIHYLYK
ncbi:hypothetical protein SNE40_013802 [Patella caerulea]|uniref:CARD domain-containing protein n=1 Tax=Patella caerulea TaxID=87958 RepID=A0AAN8JFR8_PATCE